MPGNWLVSLMVSPVTLPLYVIFISVPPKLAVMLKEMVSPSTLPSLMVDLPNISLLVSPVSLAPSTLKVKVRWMDWPWFSAVPFQLPLMSAAEATAAKHAARMMSHFMEVLLLTRGYDLL